MHELANLFLPLLAGGAVAGLLAGLLGIGGGIVMVPVLGIVLAAVGAPAAVSMHIAVATSSAVIILTALVSACAHARRGAVDRDIVRRWAPLMATGAFAGAIIARQISGNGLRLLFAALAIFVGLKFLTGRGDLLLRRWLRDAHQRAAAIAIGGLSAWLGIGGGSFTVPLLHAGGMPLARAVGSSALLGWFIALPATLGFVIAGFGIAGRPAFSIGFVHLPSVVTLAAGAVLLAPAGAALSHRMPQLWLRRLFGLFLLLAAARLVVRSLGST